MERPGEDADAALPPQDSFREFEPLRKKPKLMANDVDSENNYMPSYYNPAAEVLRRTPDEIRDIRIHNEISVQKIPFHLKILIAS
jgi:hypothetical protein